MAGTRRRTREPRGRSVGVNLAPACLASRQKCEASIAAGCSGFLLGCWAVWRAQGNFWTKARC